MQPGFLRQPTVERLPNLLTELASGAIRIPPFQRDFVWTGEQRVHLFDSVRKGLPVGSLMVWRTARQLASDDPIGPFTLGKKSPFDTPFQYLLDGRQRMTSLFAGLAAGIWTRQDQVPPLLPGTTAPDGSPWELWFDLEDEAFFLDEGAGVRLPMAILLDDFESDEWLREQGLDRRLYNRARALKSAFLDYLVPVVPLATDDLTFVTLSFKRVNSGGTVMSDVHMARALAWTEDFDLGERIDVVKEPLRELGWGELNEDAILKVIAAACGLEPTEYDVEDLANEVHDREETVDEAGTSIVKAVGFLADMGICGPQTLPYEGALTFTARALGLDEVGTTEQFEVLRAWVAEVCITERFGNAPPHVQRAMWDDLRRRLGIAPGKRRGRRREARESAKFSMAWARSRVAAVVLAAQKPRLPDQGEIDDVFRILAQRGTDATPMFISQRKTGLPRNFRGGPASDKRVEQLLTSVANRVLCPVEHLTALRGALTQANPDWELLRSHMISKRAHSALISGDIGKFLLVRRKRILAVEREWLVSMGVDSKSVVIKEAR